MYCQVSSWATSMNHPLAPAGNWALQHVSALQNEVPTRASSTCGQFTQTITNNSPWKTGKNCQQLFYMYTFIVQLFSAQALLLATKADRLYGISPPVTLLVLGQCKLQWLLLLSERSEYFVKQLMLMMQLFCTLFLPEHAIISSNSGFKEQFTSVSF